MFRPAHQGEGLMRERTWLLVLCAGRGVGLLLGLRGAGSGGGARGGNNVWTSLGPGGEPVGALAIDPIPPTTLYAGTGGNGVFKSTNGGSSWSAVNTGLPDNF